MKYYHVTDFGSFVKIKSEGLRANKEGEIFVFDDIEAIPYAAINQLFLTDYAIFEIDSSGITGNIENDNAAELTSKHQFIIYQDLIEPKHMKFLGMFTAVLKE